MTAVLAIWNDCGPGREEAYEIWYREEHLIERLSVPGFKVGRRYRALQAERQFLTTYEVDDASVLSSPAYRERLENPTPRTKDIMLNGFDNMCRTVCVRTDLQGAIRGAYAVTVAWVGQEARFEHAKDARADDVFLHSEIWISAEDDSQSAAAEESLRGKDAKITGCAVFEFDSEPDARAQATRMRRAAPEADVGVYQLLCELRAEELS